MRVLLLELFSLLARIKVEDTREFNVFYWSCASFIQLFISSAPPSASLCCHSLSDAASTMLLSSSRGSGSAPFHHLLPAMHAQYGRYCYCSRHCCRLQSNLCRHSLCCRRFGRRFYRPRKGHSLHYYFPKWHSLLLDA